MREEGAMKKKYQKENEEWGKKQEQSEKNRKIGDNEWKLLG